ncbi:MAG: exo-alpha-sialidase, partial [Candidatus Heimdallarchaeota archaeon]|nr:exo-alpha-sialidase [Candidatus Heimdallarchaeota archaeon]
MYNTLKGVLFIAAVLISFIKNALAFDEKPIFQEHMVAPSGEELKFSHGSTVVELPDRSLYCAWYAGSREKGDDVAIWGSRLEKESDNWSKATVIIDTPGKSEGNPVLFLDRNRLLWLFYQTMYGSGEGRTKPGTGWTT